MRHRHSGALPKFLFWLSFFPIRNGRYLAVFKRGRERVLAAGDCVYERFTSDNNPHIKALHTHRYSAVVVPHHGDKASAKAIVPAARDGAKAFFSAGTHQGYKHPTAESLNAHVEAKFTNIENPSQLDIVKVNLL